MFKKDLGYFNRLIMILVMIKILDSKSFKATADNFRGGGYYRKFKLFVCVMTFLNKT